MPEADSPDGSDGADDRSLLTQDVLARRWNLSVRTIEAWRSRGVGPAWLRIGRCVRYRPIDIETYEAEQRQKPDPAPIGPKRSRS